MKNLLSICMLAAIGVLGLQAQPEFQSQEEVDAFTAVQSAPSNEARAKAGSDFMAKFPASKAKGIVAYITMLGYQGMNDFDNMLLYGDEVLNATEEPGIVLGTLVALSGAIPNRTREFDLDKEEKLSKAEDYAKRAMTMIPTLQKPDPNIPDDQWLATKKEFMSQCHEAVGIVAVKREDFAAAETSLRQSMNLASKPEPSTLYNLALALNKQGKKDEAAGIADRCIEAGGYKLGDGTDLCAKAKGQ